MSVFKLETVQCFSKTWRLADLNFIFKTVQAKILNLSRNCPSQPSQFISFLFFPVSTPFGKGNPTSWNALPESAAKVVFCGKLVLRNFSKTCRFDDRHVSGTNRFRTSDLVCSTTRWEKTSAIRHVLRVRFDVVCLRFHMSFSSAVFACLIFSVLASF